MNWSSFCSKLRARDRKMSIVRVLQWIYGLLKICTSLDLEGGTRKRKIDKLDDGDSDFNSVAKQPKSKPRKNFNDLSSSTTIFFGSSSINVNMVLDWLRDDEVTRVGIYGMGGIGKTTLAEQVCCWINDVAWIYVGTHFNSSQLRNKIANELGIDLQGDKDETRRAAILHSYMSQRGKCVLILDDLWNDFRLELVGIPKHCKLLITCRSLDVCHRMRCQKVVKIEPLPQKEACQLFSHTLGDATLSRIELRHTAELVSHKCAGVPLAIIMLAKNMRGIIQTSWSMCALDEVDTFSFGPLNMKDIFLVLKRSYASLSNSTLQRCFLYCALYPKSYTADKAELIRLWMYGMCMDDVLSLRSLYDKGHSIMNKLLNSCLLEACEDKKLVKMHDLIRDMAISIAKDSFMVKAGAQLTEVPVELEWQEDVEVVSLMMNSISNISLDASPKCPNLSTLLLQHNPILAIPDSFFSNMVALRVLNLSHTSIEILPSSMSDLIELRLLDLSYCWNLKQVPSLEKMHKLQFLDLYHTVIRQLPCSLEMLKMLTELNLASIPTLEKFPSGLLPKLSRLKRLTCDIIGTVSELQSLSSLKILDVQFQDIGDLSNYVRSQHWHALESFHLRVGHNKWPEQRCSRRVSLYGCCLIGKEREFVVLPDNIQELYIDNCRGFNSLCDIICLEQQGGVLWSLEICTISRCHDVEKLFPLVWMQNLEFLESIEIKDCQQLKEVIFVAHEGAAGKENYCIGNSTVSVIGLPRLKCLVLTQLPQLYSIYEGQITCASLQPPTIIDCPKLNHLPFSLDIR